MRGLWFLGVAGAAYVVAAALFLSLGYGVVVLIFRHEIGVELPNPFA